MRQVPILSKHGRLLSDDGHTRKWIRQHPDDPDKWIVTTQSYVQAEVAEGNAEEFKESDGKRWGDGRVVARIPMTELYRPGPLFDAWRARDDRWVKRFLNDSDNRKHRTFRGRV